ncbi:MAG: phenylalanine--tRNA ligase beta subunit-related protein [Desulfomonilaceae bacterium]
MFTVSEDWKRTYPGACVGILTMRDVSNPLRHDKLDRQKAELEADLRALFKERDSLKSLAPIEAYQAYFKRFKKTYHVFQQLESVVFKKKSIPQVAALVEAMFMEELRNMLLTAGHDLDAVKPPLKLDASKGDEKYIRMNGQEQVLKAGDMMIADSVAVISSVIYGPDRRTMITPATRNVLFTVYAVPGIKEQTVRQHLEGIEANVRLVAPNAGLELMDVYGTG